eukprot:TRINITY_DN9710_c0_g1_i1.p1 TRINITY_DN9710_c0_g1~~TRINITY_DN9710_c0_g1_i1.p1  ORF type:complete len:182 (+),score=37.11 TRINITY_DN9710_c0_g1_i1:91-636(+)
MDTMGMMGGMGAGKGFGKSDMMQGMMALMGLMGMMKGKGKAFGKENGKEGPKPYSGPGSWGKYSIDTSGGVLGTFIGKVRNWNSSRGYGFIECEDLKMMGYEDVFMHGDVRGDCQTGNKVKFTAFVNGKGQIQAKDCTRIRGDLPYEPQVEDVLGGAAVAAARNENDPFDPSAWAASQGSQ